MNYSLLLVLHLFKNENQDIFYKISSPSMILLWRQFSVTELGRENVQRGAAELAELTPSPGEKEGEC